MSPTTIPSLLKETFEEWRGDDALQWAAALSYYAALALAPLLILLLGLSTLLFEEQAVRDEILTRISRWVGDAGTEVARTVMESDRAGGLKASITSILLLIVGATGVFAQLQKALNEIWEVEPEQGGWRRLLKSRVVAFALVLGIGVVLVGTLVARAVLSALPAPGLVVETLNLGLSLMAFTLVLAAVYRVLPDVRVEWRDVWIGAGVTAVLFVLGQLAIGLYMGHAAPGSAYGAAGSLVAVLVWLYYTSAFLFFGAEFTQVYARERGRRIVPQEGARRVIELPAGEAPGSPNAEATEEGEEGEDEIRSEASYR